MHKQAPEVFYVKRCSQKFYKNHRKTPVPEPCEISINTLFTEHLWKTASKNAIFKRNQQQLPVNDYYKKLPKVSILHGDYLTLQKFINF